MESREPSTRVHQPQVAFDPFPPELAGCRACPRLADYREEVAVRKRRAYLDQEYWGAPVPGFGDADARLLLVGLAPGAHGSNRTGRMFTGDASGNFLYPALHRAGLASQPHGTDRADGLVLQDVWISAAMRCVPPLNKPERTELDTCRRWLLHDLDGLPRLGAVLALGKIAHDAVLKAWRERGLQLTLAGHPFAHGAVHRLDRLPGAAESGALPLIDAYHVSFQNTNTGRLTEAMFDEALETAKGWARVG